LKIREHVPPAIIGVSRAAGKDQMRNNGTIGGHAQREELRFAMQTTPVSNQPRRNSWRGPLIIGCGIPLVGALIVMVLVALNWSRVSGVVKSATGAFKELMAVQAAVQKTSGALQVRVMMKQHSGVSGTILSVQLVNPPLSAELSEQELRAKALEVAKTAHDALTHREGYNKYEIVFVRQSGAGVTVSSSAIVHV